MDAAARGWGSDAPLPARLARFVLERFPLAAYGPLIVALALCGAATATLPGRRLGFGLDQVAVILAVAAAFLQLRILDEIRDADADREGRPDRPVPRGLVTIDELRALALCAAAVGLALAVLLGPPAVASYGLALGAVWFFGLELQRFLPVRDGPVGTAILHSVIAPLVLVFTIAAQGGPASVPVLLAALAVVWGASLGVEIGRKTLLPAEERSGVETYSAAIGRRQAARLGAAALAVALGGAAIVAASSGAGLALTVLPIALAGAWLVAAGPLLRRLGTPALRGGAAALALVALLWPLVVVFAGEG